MSAPEGMARLVVFNRHVLQEVDELLALDRFLDAGKAHQCAGNDRLRTFEEGVASFGRRAACNRLHGFGVSEVLSLRDGRPQNPRKAGPDGPRIPAVQTVTAG